MPYKNAAPYLAQCLDSIRNQTIENWELIAINDHSDDDSLSILNNYSSKDDRIRCLNNVGTGIISALRLAYQHAKGTYITRMDADDIMTPKKLELLVEQIKLHGKGTLAVGLVEYISATEVGDGYRSYEQWLNKLSRDNTNFTAIYKECVVPSPAWMLLREDLDRCGAFDPDIYPEDYDLAFRMRAARLKVQATTKVVHYWRDHPQRSSRTDNNYKDNSFLKLKVYHFLKSDHDIKKQLVLWGAGNKGKKIARILGEQGISFRWITNNIKKIGKDIYNNILESDNNIETEENIQIVIAVADQADQREIKYRLRSAIENNLDNCFFFC